MRVTARPQGCSSAPGWRPGWLEPSPRDLASEVVISAKCGGTSIHRGGCAEAALGERKRKRSALTVSRKKFCPATFPWDRGACGEVTLVPSDRGSLDGGRGLQWSPEVSRVALGCLPTFLAHTPCSPRSARQLLPQAPLVPLLRDTKEPLLRARPHQSAAVVFTLPQGRGLSHYSHFTGEDTGPEQVRTGAPSPD